MKIVRSLMFVAALCMVQTADVASVAKCVPPPVCNPCSVVAKCVPPPVCNPCSVVAKCVPPPVCNPCSV
jgi:hypothetical protein